MLNVDTFKKRSMKEASLYIVFVVSLYIVFVVVLGGSVAF